MSHRFQMEDCHFAFINAEELQRWEAVRKQGLGEGKFVPIDRDALPDKLWYELKFEPSGRSLRLPIEEDTVGYVMTPIHRDDLLDDSTRRARD